MSSHHSQRFFNLHHNQVSAGKERQQQRQADRYQHYLSLRSKARREYSFVLCLGFIWFAYMNIATAVYLGYVI